MDNKLELEWEWMYNPILWNIFVVWQDWKDYVVVRQQRMAKDTIYKDKETYLDYIKPQWKNSHLKN
jgi:hypothetical protein